MIALLMEKTEEIYSYIIRCIHEADSQPLSHYDVEKKSFLICRSNRTASRRPKERFRIGHKGVNEV